MLRISTGVRESLGDVVVKDIEGILLLRPRLLKGLKAYNGKLFKNKKTYLNATATFRVYTLVIRTKGVRPYIVGLVIYLKDFLIRLLILKGCIGKVI